MIVEVAYPILGLKFIHVSKGLGYGYQYNKCITDKGIQM